MKLGYRLIAMISVLFLLVAPVNAQQPEDTDPEGLGIVLLFPADAQGGTIKLSQWDCCKDGIDLEDKKSIELAQQEALPVDTCSIENCQASFDDLEPGIYLLEQPENCDGYNTIDPFLVDLDGDTTVLHARPKMSRSAPLDDNKTQNSTDKSDTEDSKDSSDSQSTSSSQSVQSSQNSQSAQSSQSSGNSQSSIGSSQNSSTQRSSLSGQGLSSQLTQGNGSGRLSGSPSGTVRTQNGQAENGNSAQSPVQARKSAHTAVLSGWAVWTSSAAAAAASFGTVLLASKFRKK